jgi:uncharacterized protein YjbI with pentapeptide repeats
VSSSVLDRSRLTRRRRRISRHGFPTGRLALGVLLALAGALGTVGLTLAIPGTVAGADTVVGGCTIVSSPTPSHFTNCPGADLSGAGTQLSGIDLSFANLAGATFVRCPFPSPCTSADLTGTNLTDAHLADAVFFTVGHFAQIDETPMPNANLTGADLFHAAMSLVNLDGATLVNTNLTDADMSFRVGTNGTTTFRGATLTGAVFTGTVLVPPNQTATENGPTAVSWSTPAPLPGATPGSCTPPSGSIFPAGTTTVSCTVIDDNGNQGSGTFVVTAPTSLTITTKSLPPATIGAAYSASLAAVGGNPPYRWKIVSGAKPKGLKFDGATGAFSGVPSRRSTTSTFAVEVHDKGTRFDSRETAGATFTITLS